MRPQQQYQVETFIQYYYIFCVYMYVCTYICMYAYARATRFPLVGFSRVALERNKKEEKERQERHFFVENNFGGSIPRSNCCVYVRAHWKICVLFLVLYVCVREFVYMRLSCMCTYEHLCICIVQHWHIFSYRVVIYILDIEFFKRL